MHCTALHCTGWLLFLQHRERRGAAPWCPSKAWPPLPVLGADGYQMAGEERGGGVLYSLPLILYPFCLCMVIFLLRFSTFLLQNLLCCSSSSAPKANYSLDKGGWKQVMLNLIFAGYVPCYVFLGVTYPDKKNVIMTHFWSMTHSRPVYFKSLHDSVHDAYTL